ncbi:MAG: hypothetical protein ABH836_02100 [Candidatus Omnitrophota bacterium]
MELFSRLSKREKIFLYAVTVFVGAALLDKAVIMPIGQKFNQLKEDILIDEKILAKNVRILEQEEIVLREHKQFEDFSKPVGSDEEEMAKFLNNIEKFARDSSVYLVDIKPRPIVQIEFYKKYIMEIDSEAEMKGLINFLYKIENSEGLIKIEKAQFNLKKTGSPVIKGIMVISKMLIP